MLSLFRFLLLALCALAFSAQGQSLYKWVDHNGKVHYSDQPPPQNIKKVEQPRLRAETIDTRGLPYETQQAAKNFPVTLFTSADCKNSCDNARALLQKRGVPFAENRLDTPEQLSAIKQRFGSDSISVPAITVGSEKQQGFSESSWNGLLDAAGYGRTAIPGVSGGAPAAAK